MRCVGCGVVSCLIILLAGCSSFPKAVVHQPVGPASQVPSKPAQDSRGELVVYSEFEYPISTGDETAPDHHSDYFIYKPDGTQLKLIRNETEYISDAPAVVRLAPGHYEILADSDFGTVEVPVVIDAGKTTIVHLDGSKPAAVASQTSRTNLVRLPDGEIVGWRAVE